MAVLEASQESVCEGEEINQVIGRWASRQRNGVTRANQSIRGDHGKDDAGA
jgi:hypothetical protein